eukprot:TRINITY_DN28465_c0_g1_i1.p2 TRINITY_DN28465_c0_g1~~TRINITY_DN28465_c0_g1_i1.p2  ORF type:complete len:936 (+),score=343.38 TRINITY_DN28465_c0_g1_i1:65-2872(+)
MAGGGEEGAVRGSVEQLHKAGAAAAEAVARLYLAVCVDKSVRVGALVEQLVEDRRAGHTPWPVLVARIVQEREEDPAGCAAPLPDCPAPVLEALGGEAEWWDADCATMLLRKVLTAHADCAEVDSMMCDTIAAFILRRLEQVDADALFRCAAGRRAPRVHSASWVVAQRLNMVRRYRSVPPARTAPLKDLPARLRGGPESRGEALAEALRASMGLSAPATVSAADIAALCAVAGENDPREGAAALRVLCNWVAAVMRPFRNEGGPGVEEILGPSRVQDLALAATAALRGGARGGSRRDAVQLLSCLAESPRLSGAVASCLDYSAVAQLARGGGTLQDDAWTLLAAASGDPCSGPGLLAPDGGAVEAIVAAAADSAGWGRSPGAHALLVLAQLATEHPPATCRRVGADPRLRPTLRMVAEKADPGTLGPTAVRNAAVLLGGLAPHCPALADAEVFVDALFRVLEGLLGKRVAEDSRAWQHGFTAALHQCLAGIAQALDPEGDAEQFAEAVRERVAALRERVRTRHLGVLAALSAAFWQWEKASDHQVAAVMVLAETAELLDARALRSMLPEGARVLCTHLISPRQAEVTRHSLPLACTLLAAVIPHATAEEQLSLALVGAPPLLDAAAAAMRERPPADAAEPLVCLLTVLELLTCARDPYITLFCWRCCGLVTGMDLPCWLLAGGGDFAPPGGIPPQRVLLTAPLKLSLIANVAERLPSAVEDIVRHGFVHLAATSVARHPVARPHAVRVLLRCALAQPAVLPTLAEHKEVWRGVLAAADPDARSWAGTPADQQCAALLVGAALPHLDEETRALVGALDPGGDALAQARAATEQSREEEARHAEYFRRTHAEPFDIRRRRFEQESQLEDDLRYRRAKYKSAPASKDAEAERWKQLRAEVERKAGAGTWAAAALYTAQAAATIALTTWVLLHIFWWP